MAQRRLDRDLIEAFFWAPCLRKKKAMRAPENSITPSMPLGIVFEKTSIIGTQNGALTQSIIDWWQEEGNDCTEMATKCAGPQISSLVVS